MNNISPEQTARRMYIRNEIESSFKNLCIHAASVSGGVFSIEEFYSYTNKCLMAWYEKVFDIDFAYSSVDEVIDNLVERMGSGRIPENVLLSSDQVSRKMDSALCKKGFEVVYEQTNMAITKDEYTGDDAGFEMIRRIQSDGRLDDWIACLELSFGRSRNKILYERLSRVEGITFWGLYEGDTLASTLGILETGKTAGLQLVSTHPEYRNKGYASIITRFALHKSFTGNSELAVLQSSRMAGRMYSRLGFREFGRIMHLRMTRDT